MQHFISVMKPGKAGMPESMTAEDRTVFGMHTAYLRKHVADGKIVFAGPSVEEGEEHFAIVVLSTGSKNEAVQIMNADPAVAHGLLTSHVTEFEVFASRRVADEQPTAAEICYVEIPAPDIEKAGAFYSTVFGWQIKPSPLAGSPYWEFRTGDDQLSGGLVQGRPPANAGVLLYLKVQDIDEALRQIQVKGGVVASPKAEIGGGYGYSALFEDPNGNRMGLYSPR